jgi:hypothetical protein
MSAVPVLGSQWLVSSWLEDSEAREPLLSPCPMSLERPAPAFLALCARRRSQEWEGKSQRIRGPGGESELGRGHGPVRRVLTGALGSPRAVLRGWRVQADLELFTCPPFGKSTAK